jgi:hypothetical protein
MPLDEIPKISPAIGRRRSIDRDMPSNGAVTPLHETAHSRAPPMSWPHPIGSDPRLTEVADKTLIGPALAADYEAAKSRGQCEAGGGIWDQQMEKCVPTHSQRACELSNGVWDAGTSTCGK